MKEQESLLDIVRLFFKWLRPIMYITIGLSLLVALVSLFVPNYYQATTVFYAAAADQVKPGQIFGTSVRDAEFYGTDQDIDRLLTIGESREMIDFMVKKFNLYDHYEIDSTRRKAARKVREKFRKYYEIIKTKRDAIELSVEDTDKVLATQMANTAREKLDEMAVHVIRSQLSKIEQSLEKNIEERSFQLRTLGDSILQIKTRYGIYNSEGQGDVFGELILDASSKMAAAKASLSVLQKNENTSRDTIATLQAKLAGYKNQLADLQKQSATYNQGVNKLLVLERQEKEWSNSLSEEKVKLQKLKTVVSSPISAINIIEPATVPLDKSRPRRSLYVISAALLAFLFSFLGVILFETYREVDWKKIVNASQKN